MKVDLERALREADYREAVIDEPGAVLLKRLGVYAEPMYEPAMAYDWDGTPVGLYDKGPLRRGGIPADPTLRFDEYKHLLELGPRARALVVSRDTTPLEAVRSRVTDAAPEVRGALSRRHDVDEALLLELARRGDTSALHSPRTTLAVLEEVHAHLKHAHLLHLLAKHPLASTAMLDAISRMPHDSADLELAAHPNASQEAILRVAERGRPDASERAAQRADLSEASALRLMTHPEVKVRRTLAQHTRWSAVMRHLMSDVEQVRSALALNPRLLPEVAFEMDSAMARSWLAGRLDLSADLVERLAHDPVPEVRKGVATHQAVWRDLLARDPDATVRAAAAVRCSSELVPGLLADPSPVVREALAMWRREQLTVEQLLTLAADPDVRVRRALALYNRAMPRQVAERLAVDPDERVRQTVRALVPRD